MHVLNLPTDYPRPDRLSSDVALHTVRLPGPLVQQLKDLVDCENTTLVPLLLAAFQVFLYRYTGQEDILIGSPVTEPHPTDGTSGSCARWRVVHADLSEVSGAPPTFRTFFVQMYPQLADAAVDPLPLGELCAQLAIEPSPNHAPLFQAGWLHQSSNAALTDNVRLKYWREEVIHHSMPPLDIALLLEEIGSELTASFIYSTDLFSNATVARMAGHYQTLLAGIAADPDQSIALLPFLTPAERHQVLVEWIRPRLIIPVIGAFSSCLKRRWNTTQRPSPSSLESSN